MTYDYLRPQSTADRLIKKFGRSAVLRRGVADDRSITCVMIEFTTQERLSNPLIQHVDQKVLVSSVGLTIDPDNELDRLVVGANRNFVAPFVEWAIVAPPRKLDPAGQVVVYWELHVRR